MAGQRKAPGALPQERAMVPSYKRLDEPQVRSERVWKTETLLFLPGPEHRTNQTVASHIKTEVS
jgi:hypothetical protein